MIEFLIDGTMTVSFSTVEVAKTFELALANMINESSIKKILVILEDGRKVDLQYIHQIEVKIDSIEVAE